MKENKKKIVGDDLSSLIEKFKDQDVISLMEEEYKKLASYNIPITQIEDNPFLKSIQYPQSRLKEIRKILTERGFVTPLVVRPVAGGRYQLVLGRKRFLVAKKMSIAEAPVVIKDIDDHEMLLILLAYMRIEGETDALPFATILRKLSLDYHYTQKDLAVLSHVSRPTVANWMRLLKLPAEVLESINKGEISSGHGKALLMLEKDKILPSLSLIRKDRLSVRQAERLSQDAAGSSQRPLKKYRTSVVIDGKSVKVYFASAEDLKLFLHHMKK